MDEQAFAALAQPGIRGLRAYDPGLDLVALRRAHPAGALVELGSNENSHGPSPAARAAMLAAVDTLYRYPDPLGGDLKRALAARHGLPDYRGSLFASLATPGPSPARGEVGPDSR